jgi:hypothetical protein
MMEDEHKTGFGAVTDGSHQSDYPILDTETEVAVARLINGSPRLHRELQNALFLTGQDVKLFLPATAGSHAQIAASRDRIWVEGRRKAMPAVEAIRLIELYREHMAERLCREYEPQGPLDPTMEKLWALVFTIPGLREVLVKHTMAGLIDQAEAPEGKKQK